jgi:hypothetical protein
MSDGGGGGGGTVFDAREAFADEERGGDLLWSATPAQPIPLRRRDGGNGPPELPTGITPHADPPTGGAARRARVAAARAAAGTERADAPGTPAGPRRPSRAQRGGRSAEDRAIVPLPRTGGPRRLAEPRPARVQADERGRPLAVDERAVEGVRESWLVEDRWWTDRPLRRRYWEVVTDDGRDLVVFRELGQGGWYRQRG